MSLQEDNPFESPQIANDMADPERPLGRIGNVILATVVALCGFVVSFCCTCFPVSILTIDFFEKFATVQAWMFVVWGGSLVLAGFVAVLLWRWVRKPR